MPVTPVEECAHPLETDEGHAWTSSRPGAPCRTRRGWWSSAAAPSARASRTTSPSSAGPTSSCWSAGSSPPGPPGTRPASSPRPGMATETLLWMSRYTRDLCTDARGRDRPGDGLPARSATSTSPRTPQRLEGLRREAAFVRGFGVRQPGDLAPPSSRATGRQIRDRRRPCRVLGARRGSSQPGRRHAGLRPGRPDARGPDHRGRHGHGHHQGEGLRDRRRHGQGPRSAPSTSSTPPACGAARSARWPASRSRSRPRSTTT